MSDATVEARKHNSWADEEEEETSLDDVSNSEDESQDDLSTDSEQFKPRRSRVRFIVDADATAEKETKIDMPGPVWRWLHMSIVQDNISGFLDFCVFYV